MHYNINTYSLLKDLHSNLFLYMTPYMSGKIKISNYSMY